MRQTPATFVTLLVGPVGTLSFAIYRGFADPEAALPKQVAETMPTDRGSLRGLAVGKLRPALRIWWTVILRGERHPRS